MKVKVKVKESKDDWTKKELSIRVGFGELAAAVIEQWKKDGSPDNDKPAIECWQKLKEVYDGR